MQLSGLERFVEIANAGSYYQAAKAGGEISAQAYSKVVSSLEQELGVRLVKTSKKGIELTPEGSVFLGFAQTTLENYTTLQDRLRNAHRPVRRTPPVVYASYYAAAVISELIPQGLIPSDIRVCEEPFEAIVSHAPHLRENEIALLDLQDGHGSDKLRSRGLSFKSLVECWPMVAVAEDSSLALLGRDLEVSDLWNIRIVCNAHPEMTHKHRKILSSLPRETEVNRFSSVRGLWEYLRMNPECVFLADSVQAALMPGAGSSVGEGFTFVPVSASKPISKLGVVRQKNAKKSPEAAELTQKLREAFARISERSSENTQDRFA